jgi:hypothetical protein
MPTPTPTPTPAPTPIPTPEPLSLVELVIHQAAERSAELESVQFELESTGAVEVENIGVISLASVVGAVELPGLAQMELSFQFAGLMIPIVIVSADGDIYYADPFSGRWQSIPTGFSFDPADIFNPEYGVPALLGGISEADIVAVERIDGRDTVRIAAVIDQETVEGVMDGLIPADGDVEFEIWIDEESYDILKIEMVDPTRDSDEVWVLRLFGHNEPVEIADPRAS